MLKEITMGASGILLGSAVVGTVMMHSDVQVTKAKMDGLHKVMEDREITTQRFTDMLYRMDKTLEVQSQSVSALEGAVDRLEQFVLLAYKNEQLKKVELNKGEAE
ncbi:MAG: hypothetical protein ACRC6V_11260 [Bacteroidales bacterium]